MQIHTLRKAQEMPCGPMDLHRIDVRAGSKWVAWREYPIGSHTDATLLPEGCRWESGWNGSYHDAWYGPAYLVAWGRTPSRARRRLLRAVRQAVIEVHNLTGLRMIARQVVRPGD